MKSVHAVSFYTTELTKKQIDMGCLFNILWHIPFLGFLFALIYALLGLLMCCTVVLLPVGLGFLQFARFLLSPFSCAMVSRSDLEKITGEKQNSAMATFSLVIQILYFPVGCFAAVGALITIVLECCSLIGIPCGLVWAKSLATIFNPVNKVCVPKAVGDEIERIKSAETLSKYKGQNSNVQANAPAVTDSSALEEEENRRKNRPQVRMFDDNRLAEVVNNQDMYNAELVAQCTREIEIRRKSEALSEKVAAFDDGKLREIMSGAGVYSDELIYSCEKEYDHRAQLKREEMARAAEQARIEREKEAEAERIRRAENDAAMKKKAIRALKIAAVVVPVIVAICVIIYLCSDKHRYKSAIKLQEKGLTEKAVEKLSQIKDRSKYYERAQYQLYWDYMLLKDSVAAGEALVQSVRNCNWDVYEAYVSYVTHYQNDDFPSDKRSPHSILKILETSTNDYYKINAGEMYFQKGEYNDAYRIFSDFMSWSSVASGYIGIMYLYGLAGLEASAETADEYLDRAPDENPFVVHKGDLVLFLQTEGSWVYSNIKKADSYYEIAASAFPNNKAYTDRYKITQQIIKAKEKHDKISYWDRGKVYWDSYTFDNGSYEGEKTDYNNSGYPHGWGWFKFGKRELNISKFSYCKNHGLTLRFIPRESGSYAVFIGEYRNDKPVSGSYVFENGNVWTGKFKPTLEYFELINGVETDASGNKIRNIKK